jgi:hypothetical protein
MVGHVKAIVRVGQELKRWEIREWRMVAWSEMWLVTWQLLLWVVGIVVVQPLYAAAGTRLGELVHWVKGLKHKSGVLMGELNLKACGEEDMVR